MTDKKFTNEEIVKALECCLCDNSECLQCQKKELCKIDCDELATKTIDLINRQKADIERLRAKVETRTQEKLALGRIYTQKLKTVKYEAYKEFAERFKSYLLLNEKGSISVISFENIDNLLKEMVGEEE